MNTNEEQSITVDGRLLEHIFAFRRATEHLNAWVKRNYMLCSGDDPFHDAVRPLTNAYYDSALVSAPAGRDRLDRIAMLAQQGLESTTPGGVRDAFERILILTGKAEG
jgi:hypothetical protein